MEILWKFFGNFLGILWEFFGEVWLGALIWESFVNSIIILWEFLGNSLGILSEFFGDVWLEGFERLGVDSG